MHASVVGADSCRPEDSDGPTQGRPLQDIDGLDRKAGSDYTSGMKHDINLDDEPIRLFKSDFLEFFTHIHPAVIVVIWTPVVMWNLMQPSLDPSIALSAGSIVLAFLLGIVIWSFTEYTMHRFVFHFS